MILRVQTLGPNNGIGSVVTDVDTGRSLLGVTSITVGPIVPDDIVRVSVEMIDVQVDVSGHAVFHVMDPVSGELKPVKSIEFADGTRFEPDNAS